MLCDIEKLIYPFYKDFSCSSSKTQNVQVCYTPIHWCRSSLCAYHLVQLIMATINNLFQFNLLELWIFSWHLVCSPVLLSCTSDIVTLGHYKIFLDGCLSMLCDNEMLSLLAHSFWSIERYNLGTSSDVILLLFRSFILMNNEW